MESGRVNGVALPCRRSWVGKEMAKVGTAAFGTDLSALHVPRGVHFFDHEIFRDWFGKRGPAGAAIEFVERSKEWFAGDDIDVKADTLVVPELILEGGLGAILAHDKILVRLQSPFQSRIVRHRPVRIETGGLLFFLVRENKKINGPGSEHSRDGDANVSAERRSFLARDSAADHDHEIESEIRHRRHFFFSNKIFGKRRVLQGSAGILSSVKAAVAAFEDLQAARLPLQIQIRFRSRARLAANLAVLRRPAV
jgi:hypothetical protein